jgi:hypothetical protein
MSNWLQLLPRQASKPWQQHCCYIAEPDDFMLTSYLLAQYNEVCLATVAVVQSMVRK